METIYGHNAVPHNVGFIFIPFIFCFEKILTWYSTANVSRSFVALPASVMTKHIMSPA